VDRKYLRQTKSVQTKSNKSLLKYLSVRWVDNRDLYTGGSSLGSGFCPLHV